MMVLPSQDPVYERISFKDSKTTTVTDKLLSPQEPVYESIADVARNRLLSPQDEEPVYEAVYETLVNEDIPLTESSILAPAPQQQQSQQPNLDSMLGSLQSTMSKQGVATVTKGTCAGCKKPIIGQVGSYVSVTVDYQYTRNMQNYVGYSVFFC